jgi:hypothetical protein
VSTVPPSADRTPAQRALQGALGAEHAAVYGYGVLGARLTGAARETARQALDAHRARRDELARQLQAQGGRPQASAAAYALPFEVTDAASATRLAVHLEEGVAAYLADLVAAVTGDARLQAARWLQETAVRAVRWRGAGVTFPGMPERVPGAGAAPSAARTGVGG